EERGRGLLGGGVLAGAAAGRDVRGRFELTRGGGATPETLGKSCARPSLAQPPHAISAAAAATHARTLKRLANFIFSFLYF
nr:hypothetical protein [Pyrinomonadaceae bacterium]